ncbi:MAG: hypothetical protein HOF61_06475 [Verrucomicrobia bacterium]|nr:hypothetical protein [Verrucomicrobiota bacterium]
MIRQRGGGDGLLPVCRQAAEHCPGVSRASDPAESAAGQRDQAALEQQHAADSPGWDAERE